MKRTCHIDLLICDCDGVLVDSEILSERLMREALAAHVPLDELEVLLHGTFGLQSRDILARVEKHFAIRLPLDFHTQHLLRCEALIRSQVQVIPGVHAALHSIDLPLAIASNGRYQAVEHALLRSELSERVDIGIFAAEQVERPKPAPDLYLLAAKTAGVAPQRCLVVEDSATGVPAALAAGMQVIGFLGASHIPSGHGETLRQLGVHHLIEDMRELPALVERLCYAEPAEVLS